MSTNHEIRSTNLKICYWNIHGSTSSVVPDKFGDSEFLEKLADSDIVALSELHTERTDISLPGYKLLKQKIRDKKHKGPKIGGSCIY